MARRATHYHRVVGSSAPSDPPAGGGGAPAWVPANANIHIDFLGGTPQGRAWVQGTGEVAIDTLLGADANTGSGWEESFPFDPGNLYPNGYESASSTALIGAARDLLTAGATTVYQIYESGGGLTHHIIALSGDGWAGIQLDLSVGTGQTVNAFGFSGDLNVTTGAVLNTGSGAINCIAVTLVSDRLDFAVNGNTANTSVLGVDELPVDHPIDAFLFQLDYSGGVPSLMQSITLYDPLPDTTGLSDLSEV